MRIRANRTANTRDTVKDATLAAINRVLEPLIELMLDTGVTVRELNTLARNMAVGAALKRLTKEGNKESKSRAAIMTGLPRSEVAKILATSKSTAVTKLELLPAKRVLAAWKNEPSFLADNGNPAVLPIFGRTFSFEQLVDEHGGGNPVRAMLDELTRLQAIVHLSNQRVKVRHRDLERSGLDESLIESVSEGCHNLLRTLSYRRERSKQSFQGMAVSVDPHLNTIPVVREEMIHLVVKFLEKLSEGLLKAGKADNQITKTTSKYRIGIAAYLFEEMETESATNVEKNVRQPTRKNLRRRKQSDDTHRARAIKRPSSRKKST